MRKVNSWLTTSILVISLLTISIPSVLAQTACTQTLRLARTVYDEGRIHELEELLSGCLKNGFSDEERTEAYRLLILSYIYLDESDKADETMLLLLREDPGFAINNDADPAELINLYNTFRTKPIFFWGLKFNVNTTFINVLESYSVLEYTGLESAYNNRVSIGGGAMLEKSFGSRITARANFEFNLNTFDYAATYFNEDELIADQLATENLNAAGLGLMAQVRLFPDKDEILKNGLETWNPYIGLGGTFSFILTSSLALETDRTDGSSADGPEEDLIKAEIRRQLNPTIDAEFGVKKRIGLSYLNIALRYSYGLLNLTDRHYDQGRLTTFYGWAANDINMHTATITFGILFPQYVPKKMVK